MAVGISKTSRILFPAATHGEDLERPLHCRKQRAGASIVKKRGRVGGACVCFVVHMEVSLIIVSKCFLMVDLKIAHLIKHLLIFVSLSRRCSESLQ